MKGTKPEAGGSVQPLLDGWKVKSIREVASLKNGYSFKSADYVVGGKYRIVTIANVQAGSFRSHTLGSVNDLPQDLQSHQILNDGDIVMSMTGNVGRVCRVRGENNLLNQRVGKLVPFGIDARLLFHVLNQDSFSRSMMDKAKGGAQGNISVSDILEYEIAIPDCSDEQRAIAAALTEVDDLVAALDALIDKKRAIQTAAMQRLLTGRQRLAGFEDAWETKVLGDVADIIDPHPSHRAPPVEAGGIPFVGIGDVSIDGRVDTASARRVSPDVYLEHQSRYRLENNVLGLGRVASIGKVVRLDPDVGPYAVSPTLAIIDSQAMDSAFLFYFLSSSQAQRQFDQISSGSTRQSVGMNVLRKIEVTGPVGRSEQEAIAAVLSDMDAEIAALEARRDKTRHIKTGMMQELLTGRTRLF